MEDKERRERRSCNELTLEKLILPYIAEGDEKKDIVYCIMCASQYSILRNVGKRIRDPAESKQRADH